MIAPLYQTILGPDFRVEMANVLNWLEGLLKLPQFVNRIGRVKFAQKPIYYLLSEPKEEAKDREIHSASKIKAQKYAKKK